jgi:hypothetical protein
MKQTNIFDFLGKNIDVTADEANLTDLENNIKRYIYVNHKGYQNGISAKDLSDRFDLGFEDDGGRALRRTMAKITAKSIIDFDSGNYGYFACIKSKGEIRNGNRIRRAIGSLKTIIEGDPKAANIIYSEMYKIRQSL